MPAIKAHKTATSEAAWDGPAAKTDLKLDQDAAFYGKAFAWKDPNGDETKKASYRFIHHFVDAEGNPGAASTEGCTSGCGVLNGARGGTTIPDADRAGVHAHLATHLEDAGMAAPDLKALTSGEVEHKTIRIEYKADGEPGSFTGIASVMGIEDLGGDVIEAGAFNKTIQENKGCPVLWQHDSDEVIGVASLTVEGNKLILNGQLDMDDPVAVKAYSKMKKKLIKGLSIGFQALKTMWEETTNGYVRHINELKLWEVSVVTFPMLPEAQITGVKRHSAEDAALDGLIATAHRERKDGRRLSAVTIEQIQSAIDTLQALLAEEVAEGAQEPEAGSTTSGDGAANASDGAAAKSAEPVIDHSALSIAIHRASLGFGA